MSKVWTGWVVVYLALQVGCASSGEPDVDRRSCERLREHVIEVRLAGLVDDRNAHREAARQALGNDFVSRCVADTTPAELECSLAAKSLDALHTCSRSR